MSTFDGKTAEVIAVRFGEKGYYPTTYGRQTKQWVEDQNARIGIDPATAQAFETCSFGNWGNYETVLKYLQEALSKTEKPLCVCTDPMHPDNPNCKVHEDQIPVHWVGKR
jgi:hypothetical protein